jgi:hypothetical protein
LLLLLLKSKAILICVVQAADGQGGSSKGMKMCKS